MANKLFIVKKKTHVHYIYNVLSISFELITINKCNLVQTKIAVVFLFFCT